MATATFGLKACVKREIQALGYEIIGTENGHVAFLGDERAIARCNLWLRCADRVLLVMGQFPAETFEDLFQQTKGIAWEELIPPDGKFTVIGSSVKSRLHSVPACQSIVKKAVAERLGGGRIRVELRNRFREGEIIEALTPGRLGLSFPAANITDREGNPLDEAAVPMALYDMDAPEGVEAGDFLRVRCHGNK